jgi:hypothetical protein
MLDRQTQRAATWARPGVLVLTTAVVTSLVTGAAFAAASQFADIDPGHPHEDGIGWVADVGVTAGCGDGSRYCPGNPVTRAQMGTFMHRLSGHAPGVAPSVDAATLQGMSPGDLQGQQGPAGEDATSLWAVVDDDGTLVRGSGVVHAGRASLSSPGEGRYQVTFEQDVSECAYQATIGSPEHGGVTVAPLVSLFVGDIPEGVAVSTSTPSGFEADLPFHLAVFC